MARLIRLSHQIHGDIYRALRCVEENELDGRPEEALMKVSSLASELLHALEAALGQPAHDAGPRTDRASKARRVRNEGRWPAHR